MRRSLFILAGGFLIGVAVRSIAPLSFQYTLLLLGMVAATVWRMRPVRLYVLLVLGACVLGVVRTELAYRAYEAPRTAPDGTYFVGNGIVSTEPDVRDSHVNLTIDVSAPKELRLRVRVPSYPRFVYGEHIQVRGTLTLPRTFTSETGRTFDYPGYLMKDGVHYELRDARLTSTGVHEGNPIVARLYAMKTAWLDAVSQLIPEPEASLAGGIIVGAKQSLGERWLDRFRDTGLIHIVVLSGYNLTLVAYAIMFLLSRFSPPVRLWGGVAGIVGFALMTGGGATVVRASLMAILALVALHLARPVAALRALALAAIAMVAWNPFVLLFDPGFQLSFLATVGLVLLTPRFERHLTWITKRGHMREIVAATFATQLAVLPLLLHSIGSVSVVAPLVNVLALPVVPLTMGVGFAAGLDGLVSHTLAAPLALIAHALLAYILALVDLFARVPYASVEFPATPMWVIALLYAGLTVFIMRRPLDLDRAVGSALRAGERVSD